MNITQKRTTAILNYLSENHSDFQSCSEYGEVGYENPKKAVLFANWNDISERVGDYLEAAGFELEWSDEWLIDYDNDKAYRTSPNSHWWQMQVRVTDSGELLTPDSDFEDWFDYALNSAVNVLPSYVELDDVQMVGCYNANHLPSEVLKTLEAQGYDQVIFQLDGVEQFDVKYSAYARIT